MNAPTPPHDIPLPGMPNPTTRTTPTKSKTGIINDPSLSITPADIQRFNNKVIHSPHCWLWTGAISTPDGYGRFTWQHNKHQRTMLAHRFALLLHGITLNDATMAEHSCNQPLCVRVDPGHVHASTQADNLAYAVSLGRHRGNQPGALAGADRTARSRRVRDALRNGWNADQYRRALGSSTSNEPTLF